MTALLLLLGLPYALGYCNAGNTVAGDSNLGAVTLDGDTMNIRDATNCPGRVGLIDLTNLVADISTTSGKKYTLSFQATTCDTGWARLAYAYIDFNGNGVYEDPQELLGQFNVDNRLDPVNVVFEFNVPAGSVPGRTRMRVFVVESGFVTNPCLTFSYGGVKEFSIDIKGPAPPAPTPVPSSSCCLPTTFSSVSRVLGAQVQTLYTYQNWETQSYMQRVELTPGVADNSLLCLASANACFAFTASSCQRFSFVMPNAECPGQSSSKFSMVSRSQLVPGVQVTQWAGSNTFATTLPDPAGGNVCVWNTVFPNTFYLEWTLAAPPAEVFAVPALCSTAVAKTS